MKNVKSLYNHTKLPKQLERHLKGAANHWRIAILMLVDSQPDITVDYITESLGGNFKTLSHHTHKLVSAGLLNKRHAGRNVLHSLSPYGKRFVTLFKTLSHS